MGETPCLNRIHASPARICLEFSESPPDNQPMKFMIAIAMLAIVACLGSACFFMLRKSRGSGEQPSDEERSRALFRSLALRVAFSVLLFVCILLAAKLGYLHPSGLAISQ